MQGIDVTKILLVLLISACVTARAEEVKEPSSNTNSTGVVMDVKVVNEELAGLEHIRRVMVTVGDSQFTLLVPENFRLDQSDSRKISLINKENGSFISVKIVTSLPRTAAVLNAQVCRDLLTKDLPKAEITAQSERTVDGRTGPVFDLNYTPAGGTPQSVRAVFVPSPAGALEFKLVADPTNFLGASYDLNALLLSFQAASGGKLEVRPLSNLL